MNKNIRPIRIEGNLAYVPLTRGYEAVIDADDAHLVAGVNWTAYVAPHGVYAYRQPTINGKKTYLPMHRLINKTPKGFETDHIDGNGLNNRKTNLRSASRSQNEVNKAPKKNNTSGYKGVYWCKERKKWAAEIMMDGKRVHLGRHETIEAAYSAYCDASKKMHGEFARLGK